MYLTINYHLTFKNPDHKNHQVDLLIGNHQTCVYYNNDWHKAVHYRIIQNVEHEVISMIAHYQGMGYTLTQFKRTRVTVRGWHEIVEERNEQK